MIATRTLSCWRPALPFVWAAWPLVVLTCRSLPEFPERGYPARRAGLRSAQLAPDVQNALQDGDRAENREYVDRHDQQVEVAERGAAGEDQADREDHHAHRAGRDADLALDAERLRARAGIGHHQRGEH